MNAKTTINPDRLKALDSITLQHGLHSAADFGKRMCAMEAAAYVAGEPHSDHPKCVSPVLTLYMIGLNDRWGQEKRQQLKPFIPRIIGTAGDGQDEERLRLAQTFLLVESLPAWLVLAGMDVEAEEVRAWAADESLDHYELRTRLRGLSDNAWAKRSAWREQTKAKVRELLKDKPAEAAAVAEAEAAAVAVAAVVAEAVAVAEAEAAVVAEAVATAVAVAEAGLSWVQVHNVAHKAAKKAWEDALASSTDPKLVAVRELSASHDRLGLELLEKMIDPSGAQS